MTYFRLGATAAALLLFPMTAHAQYIGGLNTAPTVQNQAGSLGGILGASYPGRYTPSPVNYHSGQYTQHSGHYAQSHGYAQHHPSAPVYAAPTYQVPVQSTQDTWYVPQPQQHYTAQPSGLNGPFYHYSNSPRRFNREGAEITACGLSADNPDVYYYRNSARRYNHQGAEYVACMTR